MYNTIKVIGKSENNYSLAIITASGEDWSWTTDVSCSQVEAFKKDPNNPWGDIKVLNLGTTAVVSFQGLNISVDLDTAATFTADLIGMLGADQKRYANDQDLDIAKVEEPAVPAF